MGEILGSIISGDKLNGKDSLILAICSIAIYGIVEVAKNTVELIAAEK